MTTINSELKTFCERSQITLQLIINRNRHKAKWFYRLKAYFAALALAGIFTYAFGDLELLYTTLLCVPALTTTQYPGWKNYKKIANEGATLYSRATELLTMEGETSDALLKTRSDISFYISLHDDDVSAALGSG